MTAKNLLVIVSDEHQARAMGCAGHPFVQTPHLDAMAARGTRFTNAYTPCPICVPARASFATGQYVHETRLWDNAMPYTGEIRGWGHALQEKGISVESIGKLHYRDEKDPAGFDVEHIPMMVQGGVGMIWAAIRKEAERISPGARMLGDYIGPGESKYTEYDQAVTDRTLDWIKTRAASEDDRPWCLYVGLVAPHFPLVAPPDFYGLYADVEMPKVKLHPDDGHARHPWVEKQNSGSGASEEKFTDSDERDRAFRAYYGLTSWLDYNVGKILLALEDSGLSSETNVIYTSDHGDNLGARGLWGKSTLYEESVGIPMIVAGPDVQKGLCETPVSLLDVSQTIASQFEAKINGAKGLRSLVDISAEDCDPERVVFSEYHAIGAVSGAYMVRKGSWKLNYYVGFDSELFDLATDPGELNNLADDPSRQGVIQEMEATLRSILDPEAANAQAFSDQALLVEKVGGKEQALMMGPKSATPPPRIV